MIKSGPIAHFRRWRWRQRRKLISWLEEGELRRFNWFGDLLRRRFVCTRKGHLMMERSGKCDFCDEGGFVWLYRGRCYRCNKLVESRYAWVHGEFTATTAWTKPE